MLIYLLRNAYHFAAGLWRPALSIRQTGIVRLRVRPFDLDYNLHQNNARFLEAFEMGRFDMLVRSGFLRYVVKHRTVHGDVGI